MKKNFYFTLRMMVLLFTMTASQFSFAGLYPVITSITARSTAPNTVEYHWTAKLSEIGSVSETMMVPGAYSYRTGAAFKMINACCGAAPISVATPVENTGIGTQASIGELARGAYEGDVSSNHFTFTVHAYPPDYRIPDEGQRCLAYIAYRTNVGSWDEALKPVGCTYVPAPTEMCKITTPEILLDHGSITLKDSEGNVAKSNVGVSCTTAMSVTFHLTTDSPYINLSPSGKSEIKIEDQALGSKIDLPAGTKMLSISDMLTGVSTEGVNAGSSVLVMEPY